MNHLKDEKSPYLIQHRENPVDWYPWGEALERAQAEELFRCAKERGLILFEGIKTAYCPGFQKRLFDLPLVPCHGA